ncbi:MAG: 2-hydroxyacyl-CoA dehydratase family protein [Pseudomonadota bacterium]
MIDKFRNIFENRYDVIKEEGKEKKIIGWVCGYVPQEIIYAAGMLPIRVVGASMTTPKADAVLYSNACSFISSYIEEGLKGCYDFLDGFVAADGCMQTRRAYDVWANYVRTPFVHILNLPNSVSEVTLSFFKDELSIFKDRLEDLFNVDISEESLSQAIEVYNRTRSLLKELSLLRMTDPPPISGAEAMAVFMAGMVIDKVRYNRLLEELLEQLRAGHAKQVKDSRVRLLLIGSELDDSEFIKLIEDSGGVVVVDDLCTGTRYFWEQADSTKAPLDALAEYYLTRSPCPRISPAEGRLRHLREMANMFKVDGVIFQKIKWCHIHGGNCPIIKQDFEDLGIPFLMLEREYILGQPGQLSTRLEAFYEIIKGV